MTDWRKYFRGHISIRRFLFIFGFSFFVGRSFELLMWNGLLHRDSLDIYNIAAISTSTFLVLLSYMKGANP